MKEKDDKLRLVKQILVDDNGINSAISKDYVTPTSNYIQTTKRTDCRSRRVSFFILYECNFFEYIFQIYFINRIKQLQQI